MKRKRPAGAPLGPKHSGGRKLFMGWSKLVCCGIWGGQHAVIKLTGHIQQSDELWNWSEGLQSISHDSYRMNVCK